MVFPKDGEKICKKCGHIERLKNSSKSVIKEELKDEKETLIIDSNSETLPKTRTECPKCNNLQAFWVIRQTRAADEPETRIYRCTKCSHTWREY